MVHKYPPVRKLFIQNFSNCVCICQHFAYWKSESDIDRKAGFLTLIKEEIPGDIIQSEN